MLPSRDTFVPMRFYATRNRRGIFWYIFKYTFHTCRTNVNASTFGLTSSTRHILGSILNILSVTTFSLYWLRSSWCYSTLSAQTLPPEVYFRYKLPHHRIRGAFSRFFAPCAFKENTTWQNLLYWYYHIVEATFSQLFT